MLKIIPSRPASQSVALDEDTESNLRNGTVYTDLDKAEADRLWSAYTKAVAASRTLA